MQSKIIVEHIQSLGVDYGLHSLFLALTKWPFVSGFFLPPFLLLALSLSLFVSDMTIALPAS